MSRNYKFYIQLFDRGFTGHVKQPFGLRISANQIRMLIPQRNECGKMLDAFGLINMNGRLYDPIVGRMLSPDNYVSLPEHTQGYNRYTYALNNPLIITDMAIAGLSYQKPEVQSQSYSLADIEAAGIQLDLGRGYGMSFDDPRGYVKVSSEEGLIKYNIPGTEIIAKPINKQSWLTQFWNSEYMRMKVPDHFALSFGLNSTFVRGQSMAWSINLLTRGKEPGFSITVTDMERKGGEIDWGFDLTISRYEGNPMDINKASLEGKVKSISATWGYGGEGYMGYNSRGDPYWEG